MFWQFSLTKLPKYLIHLSQKESRPFVSLPFLTFSHLGPLKNSLNPNNHGISKLVGTGDPRNPVKNRVKPHLLYLYSKGGSANVWWSEFCRYRSKNRNLSQRWGIFWNDHLGIGEAFQHSVFWILLRLPAKQKQKKSNESQPKKREVKQPKHGNFILPFCLAVSGPGWTWVVHHPNMRKWLGGPSKSPWQQRLGLKVINF